MDRNGLLSIGEFSQWTGISRSALIYYDESGLFHPAYRAENNYRYYTYYQTITINLITTLKQLNVPLSTISALMRDRTPETLLELLSNKERDIECELKLLQEAQKIIHIFKNQISKGLAAESGNVSVRYLDGEAFSLGPQNDFHGDESFYGAFQYYCRGLKEKGGNLCYPIGGWWGCMGDYLLDPNRPDRFYSLDPDGSCYRPAGRYLVGYTRCFYGEANDLPDIMTAYARENDLSFDGPMFNTYLLDEVSTSDPQQYLLQAAVMVK